VKTPTEEELDSIYNVHLKEASPDREEPACFQGWLFLHRKIS
jgi:hypothetical protein